MVAFTALIPVVGGFIGCGIGAFLFLMDNPMTALWFIVLFIVVQQIEGNLIYPYVVGNTVGLPSMWILAAITVGGSVMGISGMLFFIPLFSTAYMLLRDEVNERNAKKAWTEAALKEKIKAHDDEEDIRKKKNKMLSIFKKKEKQVKADKKEPKGSKSVSREKEDLQNRKETSEETPED